MKSRIACAVTAIVVAALGTARAADTLQSTTSSPAETTVTQDEPVGPPKPVVVFNTPDVNVLGPVPVNLVMGLPVNTRNEFTVLDGVGVSPFKGLYTVPAGKVFVMTHVSVVMEEPSPVSFFLEVRPEVGIDAIHELAATGIGPISANGRLARMLNTELTMYVPAGETIGCIAVRQMYAGDAYALCSLSGYLVDAPQ